MPNISAVGGQTIAAPAAGEYLDIATSLQPKGVVVGGKPMDDIANLVPVGDANARYKFCPIYVVSEKSTVAVWEVYSDYSVNGVMRFDSDVYNINGMLKITIPLPKKVGDLDLYIKGFLWEFYDADATNRMKSVNLYEMAGGSVVSLAVYAADLNSIGTLGGDWDGGTVNVGDKKAIFIRVNPYVHSGSQLSLQWGSFEVEYYYE